MSEAQDPPARVFFQDSDGQWAGVGHVIGKVEFTFEPEIERRKTLLLQCAPEHVPMFVCEHWAPVFCAQITGRSVVILHNIKDEGCDPRGIPSFLRPPCTITEEFDEAQILNEISMMLTPAHFGDPHE